MPGTITPFPGATAPHQPQPPVPQAPCEHRQVTADGRVICKKVAKGQGDAEVSPALCAACPAALIGCQHLRFTLRQHAPVPITVRYAGGRVEVWDDVPPSMRFERAACMVRRETIDSPADCAGCALRLVLSEAEGLAVPATPAMEESRRAAAGRSA